MRLSTVGEYYQRRAVLWGATLEVRLAILPMHEDFAGWLSAGPREIGQSPAFPELVERRITGNGGLSAQFRAIVALEGVRDAITWEGKGAQQ